MIDNATLLIAVAFSGGALMITLVISWLNARSDGYLINWAAGMAFVVISLTVLGLRNGRYDLLFQTIPYSGIILGVALIYAGTYQFRSGRVPMTSAITIAFAGLLATDVPMVLGQSGIGTIGLNLTCAVLLALSGHQYWIGRKESPLLLSAGAALFQLSAFSFLCCAVVLALDGAPVLPAPPSNWAEQFNSLMVIVGLTGLGAMSLTLNQSRATQRHRKEAQTDSMTGLLNRRALFDHYEQSSLAGGTAVLMFDLDHFKQINDRRGHAAGDSVIRHFSAVLRRNTGADDAVARIGGEEFCVVLQQAPIEFARATAERIRAEFEEAPAQRAAQPVAATVSAGAAVSSDGEAFSTVLSRADAALYQAKDSGRNRVTVAPVRLIA